MSYGVLARHPYVVPVTCVILASGADHRHVLVVYGSLDENKSKYLNHCIFELVGERIMHTRARTLQCGVLDQFMNKLPRYHTAIAA